MNIRLRQRKPGTITHRHLKWSSLPVLPLAIVVWTKCQLLTDLKTRKLQMAGEPVNLCYLSSGAGSRGQIVTKKTLVL